MTRDFDNVGMTDSLTIQQIALREAFKDYPVQWSNSSDLMYGEPFGRDPLFWPREFQVDGIDATRMRKPQLPWEYQDGKIFTDVDLIRKSANAYLLRFSFATFWVPKRQVDYDPKDKARMIWLPDWLIKDKGIAPANWDNGYNPEFEWEPALVALGPQVVPPRSEMKQIGGKTKAKEWKFSKGGD